MAQQKKQPTPASEQEKARLYALRRPLDYDTPVKKQPEPPHINRVAIQAQTFVDAPGLVILKLEIDGKPLFIPARIMTDPPGFVAIQMQPQFLLFLKEEDAEAFHQHTVQQMAQAQQAQAVALWTPEKARKGLVN